MKAPAAPRRSAGSWQNRIVGQGEVPPDQLLPHPENAKIHPHTQTDALKGILGDLGWIDSVKVSVASGRLIDGHDRVLAALQTNQPTVPVTYVQLTEEEERYALATFDPVGSLAGTDAALMTDLLRQVTTVDPAVDALLATLAGEAAAEAALRVQLGDAGGSSPRGEFGDARQQIKAVLYAADLADFERALRLTGERNRGQALLLVCRAYCAARDAEDAEGQFDPG